MLSRAPAVRLICTVIGLSGCAGSTHSRDDAAASSTESTATNSTGAATNSAAASSSTTASSSTASSSASEQPTSEIAVRSTRPVASADVIDVGAGPMASLSTEEQVVLPGKVVFVTGKAELAPEGESALEPLVRFLASRLEITQLRIEVHSDSMGASEANMKLSQARSLAVAKALVRHGISCKRLLPVGFGETRPIAPNDTSQNRSKNRRVDFFVARWRGRTAKTPGENGGVSGGDPCQ
ncbi:MAG: OmpA family protein [Polyangiaceae bacterium]